MLEQIVAGQVLLADRAYDSDALRSALADRGAWANIKPMPRRVKVPAFSPFLYRYRNLIERSLTSSNTPEPSRPASKSTTRTTSHSSSSQRLESGCDL